MATVNVFLYSGGEWDESNTYHRYSVCGLIVPIDCTYSDMIRLISREIDKDPEKYQYELQYQHFTNGPRIRISNDSSLAFYLDLKKGEVDKRTFPLFVDIIDLVSNPRNEHISGFTDSGAVHDQTRSIVMHASAVYEPDSMEMMPKNPTLEEMGLELAQFITVPQEDVSRLSSVVINRPNINDVVVGKVFKNKDILITTVSLYAIKNRFQYVVKKSDEKSYKIKCMEKSCKWEFRASRTGLVGHFMIRMIVDRHRCSMDAVLGGHRQATSLVITNCIKDKFLSARRIYTPGDIMEDMQETYGVTVSYDKAWRSRERAIRMIRGDPEVSYGNLASYLYMTEVSNPGSYVRLETDSDNRFLFSFVALGASIVGWPHCKPVIVVDGTFLTSRYGGTLFTACTQDANNNIFILAFGVGDAENNNAWEWFLLRLREAYGDRDGMCIVSDRHGSIQQAAEKVFPNALHGACTYHLLQNLKKEFPKKGKGMRIHFNAAARAYTELEFETHMRRLDAIDKGIRGYLERVGYARWSRAHMTTDRYSTMTSNIVESVNAAIKHAKKYPIEALFECLRCTIQKWFFKNSSDARATFTRLATRHNSMLNERVDLAARLRVHPSSDIVYQVNDDTTSYVVNMEDRTCSCRRFQLDHLPCPHAVAVISKRNYSLADYCSTYFSKEKYIDAYQGTIYPLGNKEEWCVPDEVREKIVLPPETKRGPGRPKENMFKSSLECKKTSRCGRCESYGHNSRTCRNPEARESKKTKKRKRVRPCEYQVA